MPVADDIGIPVTINGKTVKAIITQYVADSVTSETTYAGQDTRYFLFNEPFPTGTEILVPKKDGTVDRWEITDVDTYKHNEYLNDDELTVFRYLAVKKIPEQQ